MSEAPGRLAQQVADRVATHPSVRAVRLVGSRADGRPTELSDYDFLVETGELVRVVRDLPGLVERFAPLAAQWDRLSDGATYYMLVLPGGIKVDLVLDTPPVREPPWQVSAQTLPGIDAHFWDWILWLGGKQLGGRDDLVDGQLGGLLFDHLLGPLGVERPPATIDEAVRVYLEARGRRETELGVRVDRALQDAVLPRLRAAGFSA